MPERETFLVTLTAEGNGPPATVRLRRWLKACLRGYGLRCLRVEPGLDEVATPPADAEAKNPTGPGLAAGPGGVPPDGVP
jgi:hypothetical protein